MEKYHVASVSETMMLLPRQVVVDSIERVQHIGLHTIWMVNEETGLIDSGIVCDLTRNLKFSFILNRELDLFEMLPVSDWEPCEGLDDELKRLQSPLEPAEDH